MKYIYITIALFIISILLFITCKQHTNESLFYKPFKVYKDEINEFALMDSINNGSKCCIAIDSIYRGITNVEKNEQRLRQYYNDLSIGNEYILEYCKMNVGLILKLICDKAEFSIKQVNIYDDKQTLVVYFNDKFKELIIIKINNNLDSEIYIRTDYLEKGITFELINKLIKSESFVLNALYKTKKGFKMDKFVAPNKLDTI